jgi:hypothetical protein
VAEIAATLIPHRGNAAQQRRIVHYYASKYPKLPKRVSFSLQKIAEKHC